MLAYGRAAPDNLTPTRKRSAPPTVTAPDRRGARRLAGERSGIPAYQLELDTIRGKCLARRCPSRWGVYRLTVDMRGREVDRYAHVECALCGRVWRRCRLTPIRNRHSLQRVLVTAILPASAHRWYARGRWHREGDDAVVLTDASIGDLDEAARAYRARMDRVLCRLQRAKDLRASREAEALTASRALMARLHAMDAERAEAEAEAARREAA